MYRLRIAASLAIIVIVGASCSCSTIENALNKDPFAPTYAENCAVCHGDNLEGGAQGPALTDSLIKRGDSVTALITSISNGFPDKGMPAFSATMDAAQVKSMAIFVAERRNDLLDTDSRMAKPLSLPDGLIETELQNFRLEVVATDIDPYAFSIAPLPNGDILLTEKKRGLSVVYPDGTRSEIIKGTPATSDSGRVRWGLDYGIGWLLDVAPHPDYANNGWIYLHHTDLCSECENKKRFLGLVEISMNRLVRGRIRDGQWVDQEVIWSVPEPFYNPNPDLAAGGRIAFDPEGYVYISVGAKSVEPKRLQTVRTPYGKIHRMHDDGSIPYDNPFLHVTGSISSIWTIGHRNPQGLEFDPATGTLWSTEMGPRGGDELNLLLPGKNYGWPLYTKGLDYDGSSIDYLTEVGLTLEDIEQPVVDFTPSPAVSSFIIYDGDAFPEWRNQFLVSSLKATELYRVKITNGKHEHTEVLLKDLARIRDIETGTDGLVYLLLEHESGSQIVKLVPQDHK